MANPDLFFILLFNIIALERLKMNETKLKVLSHRLHAAKDEFLNGWQRSIDESEIKYSDIIEKDVLDYGSKIYDHTIEKLKDAELHRKRITKIGRDIGFEKAQKGDHLEAVLDVFILFRINFWKMIKKYSADLNLTGEEFFDIEAKVDLYIDHILESIAFAYITTKEQAVVDLIEKIIK
ncbi:hypothetical protein AUK11_03675 [bacterium CG2_30_37_16]|nr:MAG: hypothetical protein AUK11_03675 [bacterium CG2_30_37_16]PIY00008.1 MAG: hypothetical protein COZ22_01330 [bacterium (Candidatus Howlettbacteria) CG_4_10_14_3_um_filter_37_10]PJB06013.1 MAG: hypothetical protein CO123_03010 [bacterium (Candidatus Howlettbacteria) CG_4_9_14_3_um_filter_37_10]